MARFLLNNEVKASLSASPPQDSRVHKTPRSLRQRDFPPRRFTFYVFYHALWQCFIFRLEIHPSADNLISQTCNRYVLPATDLPSTLKKKIVIYPGKRKASDTEEAWVSFWLLHWLSGRTWSTLSVVEIALLSIRKSRGRNPAILKTNIRCPFTRTNSNGRWCTGKQGAISTRIPPSQPGVVSWASMGQNLREVGEWESPGVTCESCCSLTESVCPTLPALSSANVISKMISRPISKLFVKSEN